MTRDDFNGYVRQLNRKLYGFAYRILLNQEEAEDAVQEIFIKLWKMKEKLNEYTSVEALATTMTKNHCIDQLRKNRKTSNDLDSRNDFLSTDSPSPYEQMERRQSYEIIRRIIEGLPEQYKTLVRLHDIDGFSYEEISETTGQNINTLRVTISRARGMIRDEYKMHNKEIGIINDNIKTIIK
jgi:RNA polymerase sigma factor (sigma-70 family)